MGSKKSPPPGSNGYRYYFGIFAGLGRGPVDELAEVRVGGKIALQPHQTESGSGIFDVPELFGGDKKEGGIKGDYHLLMGEDTQTMIPAVADMIAPVVPTGYRGRVTFFYNGLIAALNPYPKPWSFRVRRALKGWDFSPPFPDLAIIDIYGETQSPEPYTGAIPDNLIRAMNPAHIIYECLTNKVWGRGLPQDSINYSAFEYAAQILYDEGFGMCLTWKRRDSIDSFIQEVIDTIGAAIYLDRVNGGMTLSLIRNDYVPAELKLWDTSNGILSITSSKVNTSTVIINEVIVKYRDPILNEERSVNVQNLSALQNNGGVFNTMTKNYRGIPTGDIARRVAQRDLRANAQGLRRFTITMDRRGSFINPGDVMLIQDLEREILPTVVRVATVKDGTLLKGEIQLVVIQDVFTYPATSYVHEQPNTWQPVDMTPCLGQNEVFEVPYFLLARVMEPADFAFVDDTSAYFSTVVEQASRKNVLYDIAVRIGAPEDEDWPADGDGQYCGFAPLEAGFTVAPETGEAPLAVVVTDTSPGGTAGKTWEYRVTIEGDEVVSTDPNPTFEFPVAGTYAIEQRIYRNGDPDYVSITHNVEVV